MYSHVIFSRLLKLRYTVYTALPALGPRESETRWPCARRHGVGRGLACCTCDLGGGVRFLRGLAGKCTIARRWRLCHCFWCYGGGVCNGNFVCTISRPICTSLHQVDFSKEWMGLQIIEELVLRTFSDPFVGVSPKIQIRLYCA